MTERRSPRSALLLALWTWLLLGLVLVEVRRLPAGLTLLLVPYLALMARHWAGGLRRRGEDVPSGLPDDRTGWPSIRESGNAGPAGSDDQTGSHDAARSGPAPTPATDGIPTPTNPRCSRTRRRSRPPEPELSAASWAQVQPGRYVRVVETSQPAQSTEGPDAGPSSDPEAPREAATSSEVPAPETGGGLGAESPDGAAQDSSDSDDQGAG